MEVMELDEKKPRPEREATDVSLSVEREKADSEIAKRGAEIKDDTEAVADARNRADVVLASARATADENLGRAQAVQKRAAVDAAYVRAAVDAMHERAAVEVERSREDVALREERGLADEQASSERAARSRALATLLVIEREETDHHLLVERDRSDVEIGSRDDFLAIVSHDLQNMLGGMALSAASLMNIRCDDEVAREIARNAQLIQRYTAHMGRLLGDLLDVVSIGAGRLAVVPQPCRVTELLRETVEVFQPITAAKNISIRTVVKDVSLVARCDPERILQVLANLVGNAIKFTQENGSIEIVVERVEREVRFAVIDTGPGIAPDKLRSVFVRFWQLAKTDRLGLGLGLYISKSIIDEHGGRIWVESRVGEGSTFYFTLPEPPPEVPK